MSDPVTIDVFYRQKGVIPFPFSKNAEELMLQAATLSCPGGMFDHVNARFDEAFFEGNGLGMGDLERINRFEREVVHPEVDHVRSTKNETRYANFDAHATAAAPTTLARVGGGIERAQEGTSLFKFTDLKSVGVAEAPDLLKFFQTHLCTLLTTNLELQTMSTKESSIFRGHKIDLVIAFVVRYLEGKRYEKASGSSELRGRIEGGSTIVGAGANANVAVEQGYNRESMQEGALGATYLLMHVVTDTSDPRNVRIRDALIVPSGGTSNAVGGLKVFFRNARYKIARRLLGGSDAAKGILTERVHSGEHQDLDAHRRSVARCEAATSLGGVFWEEGKEGLLDVQVELREEDRVGADDQIRGDYTSSSHFIIGNSVAELSKLYSKFKRGEEVTVGGSKVVSLSPAFWVDLSGLLPICCFKDEDPDVPGRVVRDYKGATLLYPVRGFEHKANWASVDDVEDDPWEVRESIVRLPQSDTARRNHLLEKGFFQLAENEDNFCSEGEIAMARHVLVRASDCRLEGEEGPFGGGMVAGEDEKSPASTVASMPTLTSSHGSPMRAAKRKKM